MAGDVPRAVGVAAGAELAGEVIGERPGDDVDHARHRLGAVEQALAALQHLDPVDHVRRHGVQRRGGVVEPVGDPHPVDEVEDLAAARALERRVEIAERSAARRQIEPRDQGRQGLGDVVEASGRDLPRVHHLEPIAIAGQFDRQRLLQLAGDHHPFHLGRGLGPGGSGQQHRRQSGARHQACMQARSILISDRHRSPHPHLLQDRYGGAGRVPQLSRATSVESDRSSSCASCLRAR